MSKLVYITSMSLDGYVEDETGAFDWVNPDQVDAFIIGLVRPMATYLYGRRLYETMSYFEAPAESLSPEQADFARVWQKAEKIVFSRTLGNATTRKTRLERNFDVQAIQKLKRESAHDINIGGAELAGVALDADLVDECHLFVNPKRAVSTPASSTCATARLSYFFAAVTPSGKSKLPVKSAIAEPPAG